MKPTALLIGEHLGARRILDGGDDERVALASEIDPEVDCFARRVRHRLWIARSHHAARPRRQQVPERPGIRRLQ